MCFASRMRFGIAWLVALVLFSGAALAPAGGNKGKGVNISFHIETEATDNPKMIFAHQVMGKQRFFRRIPEVSSKDFVAFTPFPADDQASYGVMLQLKNNAQRRLAAVTQVNSGKWLVCQAFGHVVDGVLIEEPVNDGVVVVWRGLSLEHIKELDTALPRIGQKKK